MAMRLGKHLKKTTQEKKEKKKKKDNNKAKKTPDQPYREHSHLQYFLIFNV